jgi:TPR repeat protein
MHYYEQSADQGNAEAQRILGLHFLDRDIHDYSAAIKYPGLSAAGRDARGQLRFASFLEEGIGIQPNHILAAHYYKLSSRFLPSASACYGWCLQNGRGIPVDFTEAAEFFQRTADRDNADGANSFDVCLELGRGIEKDIERSVFYYSKAASHRHPVDE